MNIHEKYIKRCIEIAKNGLGTTRPNPMVGCVIVYNQQIIGEGYTSKYGGNHAEVNAINSVADQEVLKESSIYVTLEPCSHYGKTPPCSDLIIKKGFPKIFIGCVDDNELVAGKGIIKLKKAGIQVNVGILENECKMHHKRFFTFHNKKRPYIILKWAQTLDGFIAPLKKDDRKPVWISNEYSRQLVHKWRTEEQAILVGTNTVIADNPSLTARDWKGNNPIRIVIDRYSKLVKSSNVFKNNVETIVITENLIDFSQPIAHQICDLLYTRNITSVIIEGGLKTLQTFIDEDLWDEARVFNGKTTFVNGISAPKFSGSIISETLIASDILKYYRND